MLLSQKYQNSFTISTIKELPWNLRMSTFVSTGDRLNDQYIYVCAALNTKVSAKTKDRPIGCTNEVSSSSESHRRDFRFPSHLHKVQQLTDCAFH